MKGELVLKKTFVHGRMIEDSKDRGSVIFIAVCVLLAFSAMSSSILILERKRLELVQKERQEFYRQLEAEYSQVHRDWYRDDGYETY